VSKIKTGTTKPFGIGMPLIYLGNKNNIAFIEYRIKATDEIYAKMAYNTLINLCKSDGWIISSSEDTVVMRQLCYYLKGLDVDVALTDADTTAVKKTAEKAIAQIERRLRRLPITHAKFTVAQEILKRVKGKNY